MFILIENEQTIHIQQDTWNYRMFQRYITDDLEIDFTVPIINDKSDPIIIDGVYKIIPGYVTYPDAINSKIEQYSGPTWTVTNNIAVGTYGISPKSIDEVKNELRSTLAQNRYDYETMGVTATIQGQEVPLITARGERDIYLQTLQVMDVNSTQSWKFSSTKWLTLTHSDLQLIVQTVVSHIQHSFAQEKIINALIDDATTLQDLDSVVLDDQLVIVVARNNPQRGQ